jgi:hypothetical protein
MQTRQSATNSEGGNEAAGGSNDPVEDASKAIWTKEDEDKFVAFLSDERIQGGKGDGGSFKSSVWPAVAEHMKQITTRGGVKMVDVCKRKWNKVRQFYSLLFNKLSNRFFFKLRAAYKAVEALKTTSGLPWSDKDGLNINPNTEDAFNKLVDVS